MKKIGLILGVFVLVIALSFLKTFTGSDSAFAQTRGTKLCGVVVRGDWHDSVSVPSGWNSGTCLNFKNSIGGTEYRLGCAFNRSFSWGSPGGGTPRPNCGW
ncbi:MAG TPA: hypothetical protein VK184_24165 [Nostocaceae cyanobacterium]|nr:hypothetical protein [Nostocaceae cyanobacterium]